MSHNARLPSTHTPYDAAFSVFDASADVTPFHTRFIDAMLPHALLLRAANTTRWHNHNNGDTRINVMGVANKRGCCCARAALLCYVTRYYA